MKGLFGNLIHLDMLGPSYKFEVNGSQDFKSIWGFILTVLIIGFCATATMIFGIDIWERKKPTVSFSKISKSSSEIPLWNLPIMISIYDKNGKNRPNFEEYVSHKIVEVIGPYTNGDPDIQHIEDKYHFFHCDLSKQYDYYKQYSGYNYLSLGLYSPNFDQNSTLLNEINSENSIAFTFYFYKCDKAKSKCADDIDEAFDTLDLYFTTVDSLVDATNYTNPIRMFEYSKSVSLSNSFQKTLAIDLERAELASDEGWIFEDVILSQLTKVSNIDIQYSLLAADSIEPKVIMKLSSLKNVERITRNYLKVQEVFAKIGGIANALWITFSIILRALIRFEYYTHVRNIIECMAEDSKDELITNSRFIKPPIIHNSEDFQLKLRITPSVGIGQGTLNNNVPINQIFSYSKVVLKNQLKNDTLNVGDLSLGSNSLIRKMTFLRYCYYFFTCQKKSIKIYDDYISLSKKVLSFSTYVKITLGAMRLDGNSS